MGLLADDKEFIDVIKEATKLASRSQLRKLFVTLLVSNTMSRPEFVWEETWEFLADGILYDRRQLLRNLGKISSIFYNFVFKVFIYFLPFILY